MSRAPLEGVKVLDFTWAVAGPFTTKQFATYGATVVKIESSTHIDICRVYVPMAGNINGVNRCGAFAAYASDKLSTTLNFNKPKAIEIAKRLVAWCDIVVDNFSPGVMERLGLGWEQLKQINPGVIMIRISMQGQTGPRATQPGFGGMLQSQAGFTELVGWPDRDPDMIPVAFTDQVVPWYAALVAILALEHRDKTGRGLCLDIGQLESGLNFLAPAVLDYTVNRRVWTRAGNRLPRASPHGVYRCQGNDRWVAIGVFNDKEWQAFCHVVGKPEWIRSPKFSTLLGRKENEDELDRLVEAWTINHTAEEVMEMMQLAGVAAGVVESNKDLHEDPQLAHRHHFVRLNHPEMGLCAYDGPSFHLSKTPAELKIPAPNLGEHNHHVCTDVLGMSNEEFVQLMEEGVFE